MKDLILKFKEDSAAIESEWCWARVLCFCLIASSLNPASADVIPLEFELQASGTLRIRYNTESAIYYRVERSSDLINWSIVGNPI